MKKELEATFTDDFIVISESGKTYKGLTQISWNNASPKTEIRQISISDGLKFGKGVSLTEDELYALYLILQRRFGNKSKKLLPRVIEADELNSIRANKSDRLLLNSVVDIEKILGE